MVAVCPHASLGEQGKRRAYPGQPADFHVHLSCSPRRRWRARRRQQTKRLRRMGSKQMARLSLQAAGVTRNEGAGGWP